MLLVPRRHWIISITVAIAYPTVPAVRHNLNAISFRLFARYPLRLTLRVGPNANPTGAFAPCSPTAIFVGHNMNVFLRH